MSGQNWATVVNCILGGIFKKHRDVIYHPMGFKKSKKETENFTRHLY